MFIIIPLDARDFTDYRSSSDINNEIIQKNKINNSFEYNKFYFLSLDTYYKIKN